MVKTAKEFIETDHFNLKLDCPNHVNDIAEAMEDFRKAALQEAAEKIAKEHEGNLGFRKPFDEGWYGALNHAEKIVLSLIPENTDK